MTRRRAIALCLMLASHPMRAQTGPPSVAITEPAALDHARAVSRAIDAVAAKVSSCVANKQAPVDRCFCRYPSELQNLARAYATATRHHPTWATSTVEWSERADGTVKSRSLVMPSIARQLAIPCDAK